MLPWRLAVSCPISEFTAADAGRVSRLSGSCCAERRRRARDGDDALGNAASATDGRAACHEHQEPVITSLARHGRPMHRRRQPAVLVRAQVTRRGEKSGNGH